MQAPDTSLPRFRTDLVAQPIESDGQRFVDVTDPDSGQTFRFYEVEYFMASAMDGSKDVPALLKWALTELGVEPAESELAVVISTLRDLGYLESSTREEGGDLETGASDGNGSPYLFPEYYDADDPDQRAWSFHDTFMVELAEPNSVTPISLPSTSAPAVTPPTSATLAPVSPTPGDSKSPVESTAAALVDLPPPPEIDSPSVSPALAAADTEGMPAIAAGAPDINIAKPDMASAVSDMDIADTGPLDTVRRSAINPPAAAMPKSTIDVESPQPATASSMQDSETADDGEATIITDFSPPGEVDDPTFIPPARPTRQSSDIARPTVPELAYADRENPNENVSVDLSAHLPVGASDVKQAVQASKSAPSPATRASQPPPASLFDDVAEAGDDDFTKPISLTKSTPAASSAASSRRPSAAPPRSSSAPKSPSRSSSRPVELPHAPESIQATPDKLKTPAKREKDYPPSRSNPIVPIAVVLGVIAIFVLLYLFLADSPTTGILPTRSQPATAVGKTVEGSSNDKAQLAAGSLTATLTISSGDRSQTIEMPESGTVVWMVRDGALVDKGSVLAQLRGISEAQYALRRNTDRLEFYQGQRTSAERRLRSAKSSSLVRRLRANLADYNRSIREKKENIAAAKRRIESRTIVSPISGVVHRLANPGRYSKRETLVKVIEAPALVATFSGEEIRRLRRGDTIVIKAKQDQNTRLRCTVTNVIAGASALVSCPTDKGLRAGEQVVYTPTRE